MPLWASDKSQEAQGPSQRAVPPSAPECPEGASKAFTQCRAAWSGRLQVPASSLLAGLLLELPPTCP